MREKLKIAKVALALLAGGTAWAQTVRVNWQTSALFSDYKTYEWKPSKKQGSHFYGQWIHKDVDMELAKKGLTLAPPKQTPDLWVIYHFVTDEVMDSETTSDGFGWGGGRWGWWGGWGGWGDVGPDISTTETQPRMMGMLSVDLVYDKTKRLVWRGQATEDSLSSTQKGDEKQVLKSVDKMFEQYPPKEKK